MTHRGPFQHLTFCDSVKFVPCITAAASVHSYHHVFGAEFHLARAGPALEVKSYHTGSPTQLLHVLSSQLGEYWVQVTSMIQPGFSCVDR